MGPDYKIATVFGGTGFIGRQIVRALARKNITVKVATRVPERAYFLRPDGAVGQIVPVACNYRDPESIAEAVKGSDFVVNCIGLLFEKKRATFRHAHVDIPTAIAQACARHNIKRFVHISAIGAGRNPSRYARTKQQGEEAVREHMPQAVIMRPSIVFGPGDGFFNRFAELSRFVPVLPLIGGGHTKFQPVYVGDVSEAVTTALLHSGIGDDSPIGRTYELGGPEVIDFREAYRRLFIHTGRPRRLVTLPWGLAKFNARFLAIMPKPLLTADQVETLKTDNIVSEGELTLSDLGIRPTGMGLILPGYLNRYRPGGAYADPQRA